MTTVCSSCENSTRRPTAARSRTQTCCVNVTDSFSSLSGVSRFYLSVWEKKWWKIKGWRTLCHLTSTTTTTGRSRVSSSSSSGSNKQCVRKTTRQRTHLQCFERWKHLLSESLWRLGAIWTSRPSRVSTDCNSLTHTRIFSHRPYRGRQKPHRYVGWGNLSLRASWLQISIWIKKTTSDLASDATTLGRSFSAIPRNIHHKKYRCLPMMRFSLL